MISLELDTDTFSHIHVSIIHLEFTVNLENCRQTSITSAVNTPAYTLYHFCAEARAICRGLRESVAQELNDVQRSAALPPSPSDRSVKRANSTAAAASEWGKCDVISCDHMGSPFVTFFTLSGRG